MGAGDALSAALGLQLSRRQPMSDSYDGLTAANATSGNAPVTAMELPTVRRMSRLRPGLSG